MVLAMGFAEWRDSHRGGRKTEKQFVGEAGRKSRARALKGWGAMMEIPGLVLIQRIHLFNNHPRVKWLEELA